MKLLLVIATGLAVGCASKASSAPAPTTCNRADRHGSYYVEVATLSGNCGAVASFLTDLDAPSADPSCVTTFSKFSENDCKLDAQVKCTTVRGAATTTWSSTQETQGGDVLQAVMTLQTPDCVGTYDMHFTRR